MVFRSVEFNLVDRFLIHAMVHKLLPVEHDMNFFDLTTITLQTLKIWKICLQKWIIYWFDNPNDREKKTFIFMNFLDLTTITLQTLKIWKICLQKWIIYWSDNPNDREKKTFIFSEFEWHCEVQNFGAEYFKYPWPQFWNIDFWIGLEESFQKMHTFTPLPFVVFLNYSLLK